MLGKKQMPKGGGSVGWAARGSRMQGACRRKVAVGKQQRRCGLEHCAAGAQHAKLPDSGRHARGRGYYCTGPSPHRRCS